MAINMYNIDNCQYMGLIMPQLRLLETPNINDDNQFSDAEIKAMQRAVINLAVKWELTDEQMAILLGGISSRTYTRWKSGNLGRASIDTAARMSNLMGIHKALRLLFKDAIRGYAWIKSKNDAFNGQIALDIMLGGQLTDLMRIRRYLDTVRSPW